MNCGSKLNHDDHVKFWIRAYLGSGNWLAACVQRAYVDMASHTLKGINDIDEISKDPRASEKLKDDAKCRLREHLVQLQDRLLLPIGDRDRFDTWHREMHIALSELYCEHGYRDEKEKSRFSVGQGQKWINMALKYIFQLVEKPFELYDLVAVVRRLCAAGASVCHGLGQSGRLAENYP